MLIEGALLSSVSVSTFAIPFYDGSRTGTTINYGSGSAEAKSYGSGTLSYTVHYTNVL
jgi:hypothetical protein